LMNGSASNKINKKKRKESTFDPSNRKNNIVDQASS